MFGNRPFIQVPSEEAVVSNNDQLRDLAIAAHERRVDFPGGETGVSNMASRRMSRPGSPRYLVAAPSLGSIINRKGHGDRITEALIHNQVSQRHPSYGLHKFPETQIATTLKNPEQYSRFQRELENNRGYLRALNYNTDFYSELHPCGPDYPSNPGCDTHMRNTLFAGDNVYFSEPYNNKVDPKPQVASAFRNSGNILWDKKHEEDFKAERELELERKIEAERQERRGRSRSLSPDTRGRSPSPLRDRPTTDWTQFNYVPHRGRIQSPSPLADLPTQPGWYNSFSPLHTPGSTLNNQINISDSDSDYETPSIQLTQPNRSRSPSPSPPPEHNYDDFPFTQPGYKRGGRITSHKFQYSGTNAIGKKMSVLERMLLSRLLSA